jgi:hypothetical protein
LDSTDSGEDPVADFCEDDIETFGSIKDEKLLSS